MACRVVDCRVVSNIDWRYFRGNSGEGVRSVIATCSQGRLDWRPALGGLRVSFATSGGLAARWRLCLRGVVRSALVVLSVEEDEGLRRLAVMGGSRRGGGSSGVSKYNLS